jgi:hypothetical protein
VRSGIAPSPLARRAFRLERLRRAGGGRVGSSG